MNQVFNPIFAFNKVFGEDDASSVISKFTCHPIIWEQFTIEDFFLRVVNLFGSKKEKWTPRNICLSFGEKKVKGTINNEFERNKLNLQDQLFEIYDLVLKVRNKKQARGTWSAVFDELKLDEIGENEILRKWGTVFSISTKSDSERLELEDDLVKNTHNKLNVLSFLLHCSKDQNQIKKFLERNINFYIDNPNILKELVIKLDKIGAPSKANYIILEYLGNPELLSSIVGIDKSAPLNSSNFEGLKKLNELRALSILVDDKQKCDLFKDLAEEVFTQLLKNRPIKAFKLGEDVDDDDLFALDCYFSISNDKKDLTHTFNENNLKSLFRAFDISVSNESAARSICQRFISKTKKTGFDKVLYSPEIGYLIEPIDIAKLFIKIRLEHDAIYLLEQILISNPKNHNIQRFLAHYSWLFGDHRRAAKYYSALFGEKLISREEKIKLSKSLQYLKMWHDAFIVQKTINTLNINDRLDCAYLAQKADERSEFTCEIDKIISNSPNNQTAQALKARFLQENNQKSLSESLITSLINKSPKDSRTIKIIEEYLRKSKEFNRLNAFLLDLPTKLQKNPEIKYLVAKTKKSLGEIKEYREILRRLSKITGNIRQDVLEGILFELIDIGMFNEAETLLQTYADKWVLSPEIALARATIFLEKREFDKAEKIISSIITTPPVTEKMIIIYGCFLLKTSISEFPYSRHIDDISEKDKNKFHNLTSRLDTNESSVLVKMLQVEIESTEKEKDYKEIISRNMFSNTNDYWRIIFGLGNLNFRNNNFDQAIISLKEVIQIKPSHSITLDLLIESYSRLKLHIEAIDLLKKQLTSMDLSLWKLLKYTNYLYEHNEFMFFLDTRIRNDRFQYKFLIAKAKSLIIRKNYQEAGRYLSEIEKFSNLDLKDLPIIAQFYIDCGDSTSAKRIIEIYLSQKDDLTQKNVLESASIFYQLDDYKKALNLVNLIKKRNAYLDFIKIDILVQQRNLELARETIDEAIYSIEKSNIHKILFDDFVVSIPEIWKREISDLYFSAVLLRIKKEQLVSSFELAKKGNYLYPSNPSMNELTFKLAHILGDGNFIAKYLEENSVFHNNAYRKEILIEAENALNNGEEVSAAKLISDSLDVSDNNIYLETIQARLLYRNNNQSDANAIYMKIRDQIQLNGFSQDVSSIEDINTMINYLAICETAYELDDLTTALKISRVLITNFGLTYRAAKNFLRAITKILERNRLNDKLLIKNHNFHVTKKDLNLIEKIGNNNDFMVIEFQKWIDRCKAVIYDEDIYHEKVIHTPHDKENMSGVIYSLLSLGRNADANRTLTEIDDNEEAIFTYAVKKIENDPDKAKFIMLQLLQKGEPKPEYYMAFSIINEQLNQLTESYSAISLALDKWPEEFEWENIAGNLSMKLGNIRAAFTHFKNAEKLDSKKKYTDQIGNFSTELGWLPSIEDLDKQLTNNSEDYHHLIKIVNNLVDKERLDDAIYFIEKANAIQTKSEEIDLISGKIAYKRGEFEKSQEIVDKFLQNNPNNFEAIKLKARLIKEIESIDHAISYLDRIQKIGLDDEGALIIQKVEFIKQKNGIDRAIEYLTSRHELLENNNLLIFLARLHYSKGEMIDALNHAEEALSNDPENSDLFNLLGEVSKDLGDLDKAIDYLYKSLKIDPFDWKKYVSLSQLFDYRRDNDRAVDILMEGLDIISEDFDLLRYTGILLYKQGNYEKANKILEKALEINPIDNELIKIKQILDNSIQTKMKQIGIIEG